MIEKRSLKQGSLHWNQRSFGSRTEEEINERIEGLEKETGLSPLTLRVCLLRGLETPQAIQEFLSPRFESLTHPFKIKDMDLAVQRVSEAKNLNQRIRIFGDYDVDGTTGAALLTWTFRDFGFSSDLVDARQPDRFKDGYGLNIKAVEEAVEEGVQVLITVDCGISSFAAVQRAQELKLDLIILDHHQIDPVKGLPAAFAVVNPQRADCESGLKQLCGCGLAFYFAMALRSKGRDLGWFNGKAQPNLKQHLDLVVMATAADMVPLTGDNHILVRHGLDVLKKTQKPGVKALLDTAGLGSREISPSHLGFVIGPRINASGRMHSASLALELLTTQKPDRASELAGELERLNQERADLQNQIWDQIRARVEKGISEGKYRHGIVVGDANWHEGVVGIVASRVTEMFQKPAVVVALREDFGKGSVRTFGGKDVLAGLRECASTLIAFGGHRHAAGLSVKLEQFDAFVEAFDQAMEKIKIEGSGGALFVEGSCSLGEIDIKTLMELEQLGPFGPGNPEPVFTLKAAVKNHRVLKDRHLKLGLGTPNTMGTVEAIWFHAVERKDAMDVILQGDEQEWAAVPELNRFRGQTTPTLRVRDWRALAGGGETHA